MKGKDSLKPHWSLRVIILIAVMEENNRTRRPIPNHKHTVAPVNFIDPRRWQQARRQYNTMTGCKRGIRRSREMRGSNLPAACSSNGGSGPDREVGGRRIASGLATTNKQARARAFGMTTSRAGPRCY